MYPLIATVATYGVLTVIVLSYSAASAAGLMACQWRWASATTCLSRSRCSGAGGAVVATQGISLRKVPIAGANQQATRRAEAHNPQLHGTLVLGLTTSAARDEIVAGLTVARHLVNVSATAHSAPTR